MMSLPIIAANWKMNGSPALIDEYQTLCQQMSFTGSLWVFPPALYLAECVGKLTDHTVVGAQNVAATKNGAYTGEISARMLKSVGVTHCLLGHSERRQLFGESGDIVAAKLSCCLDEELSALFCVGETLVQRDAEQTFEVLCRQLEPLRQCDREQLTQGLAVAYEPVWAIGTGQSASPAQAQQVHRWMRDLLCQWFGSMGQTIPLLYGGSVKSNNAASLLAQADIDGLLVGGASLAIDQFVEIIRCTA